MENLRVMKVNSGNQFLTIKGLEISLNLRLRGIAQHQIYKVGRN